MLRSLATTMAPTSARWRASERRHAPRSSRNEWPSRPRRPSRNTSAYATFFRGMLSRGIYPPPSQFEAWFLSAAHTDGDVKKTIAAAKGAMKEVARAI